MVASLAMVGVSFSCVPKGLTPTEMEEIRNIGYGELYLVDGRTLHPANATNIPARDIGRKKFLLHGHSASKAVRDGRIKITHTSSGAIVTNSASGKVRLWRKDGGEARLKAPAPQGDFIPSGYEIPAAEIGARR